MGDAQLVDGHIRRTAAADRRQLMQKVATRPSTATGKVARQQCEELVAGIKVLWRRWV